MGGKKKSDKEKPLDKMTTKDLKEVAKEISEITGIHGLNKQELLVAIKKSRGIEEKKRKKSDASIKELKQKINVLKNSRAKALESQDKETATVCRRRIARLKKKTRKAA